MSQNIASTAIVHPSVELGENVTIEDFCLIGAPPRGKEPGDIKTVIGDHAIIRSHTVIYAGNSIGENFQTGNKVNIRENNKIGNNVSIGTLSIIEHQIIIEDNVRIHSQVFVPEFSQLKRNCWLGPNVVLTNAAYPKSRNVKEELSGPVIEEDAIIGANSTILPGVLISKNSIVGAGSVVTKDTHQDSVHFGNPAIMKNNKSNLPY